MNIVYILGNGFDKAQEMATGYPDFYKHLQTNITGGSRLLNLMKEKINENQILWSDMEERLGAFTSESDKADEFADFYFELNDLLQKYLEDENEKFLPTKGFKEKFYLDFTQVSKYLGPLDKNRFGDFVRANGFSVAANIYVITLNYTNTLEKILGLSTSTSKNFGGGNVLQDIIHVHGQLGNSIIIGVDNVEQMKNLEFRNNEDIKDLMIKIQSNQVMKETRHIQCEDFINKANLIILFGVSLGDTDARWWRIIGNNLVKRTNVAVMQHLYYPDEIIQTQLQKRGRLERGQQKCLMQKMRIEDKNWTDDLRNRLFFTVNESIFKL